jgi:hypothetical protein
MKWKELPAIAWAQKEPALWIACFALIAWAYLNFGWNTSDRTDTLGQDLSASSQTFGSAPARSYPPPHPTPLDQDYRDCPANALGPNTLLLHCMQTGQHVVTLNDILTLPQSHELGKQASEVLNSATSSISIPPSRCPKGGAAAPECSTF